MNTIEDVRSIHPDTPGKVRSSVPSRQSRRLLLALLGDQLLDTPGVFVPASAFIAALGSMGIAAPAVRVALDRLVHTGILSRERRGRSLLFSLTTGGIRVLAEASERVRGKTPFRRHGDGWTLVTFSIPEGQRALRHRLRSILSWKGFAPLRDGLWLAPGEIQLEESLRTLTSDLPDGSVVAFHARALRAFPIAASVRQAWDVDRIRAAHLAFIDTWSHAQPTPALATQTMLVADWLALLRVDPGLPTEYMDADWPADRSIALYHSLRTRVAPAAHAEFSVLAGTSTTAAR